MTALELAFRLDGPVDAPVIVFSPSLGTTTSLWDAQLPTLVDRFRILRHDHPGHGGSPASDQAFEVEDIARAVLAELDRLEIERASFCGLSLGGMVGMWLGANAPERIELLVLACTGARLFTFEHWSERAALVRAEGTDPLVEISRERWFTPAFREAPDARRLLDALPTIDVESYARCCEALAVFDFRGELDRVTPDTLVVAGEDDPVIGEEVVDTLVHGIAGAELVVIRNAAHLANVEQPAAFDAALRGRLEPRERA